MRKFSHQSDKDVSRLWPNRVTDVGKYHHDSSTSLSLTWESCIINVRVSCHTRATTCFVCKINYSFEKNKKKREFFSFFIEKKRILAISEGRREQKGTKKPSAVAIWGALGIKWLARIREVGRNNRGDWQKRGKWLAGIREEIDRNEGSGRQE